MTKAFPERGMAPIGWYRTQGAGGQDAQLRSLIVVVVMVDVNRFHVFIT